MPSGLSLALIILAVAAASLFFLIQAEGGIAPVLDKYGLLPGATSEPVPRSNPTSDNPFTSGTSRFSQGRCTTNSECQVAGCSGEVCTNQGDVITTCEFSDSFPNAQGLTCGCVQGVCGWE